MAKPVLKFRLNLPLRGPVMATREGLQSARARLEATRSPRRVSPDTVTAPLTARSEAPPHSPRASTRVNFSAGDAVSVLMPPGARAGTPLRHLRARGRVTQRCVVLACCCRNAALPTSRPAVAAPAPFGR